MSPFLSLSIPSRVALLLIASVAAAAALPAAAAGRVEVTYIEPQSFADTGRNAVDREQTLKLMSDYLQSLGAKLPDGQTLRLEVTDLDLAGIVEPFGWRSGGIGSEVRVMRGRADWPHMNLRYTLVAEGRVLKTGDAKLADMNYMHSLHGRERAHSNDALAYEKHMVRRWFDETFVAH